MKKGSIPGWIVNIIIILITVAIMIYLMSNWTSDVTEKGIGVILP